MQMLRDVLENYLTSKSSLQGKAFNASLTDQKSLLVTLPAFFTDLLIERGRAQEFKVEGSIGNGNMARVPWVGIFNKKVTTSAQDGYYIVLLFAEDMNSCFLSLNQGVTAVEALYGKAISLAKMRGAANRALPYLAVDPLAQAGVISLQAKGNLGKGYEQGAIVSFKYELLTLPDAFSVAGHFLTLLEYYDRLVSVAGQSLQVFVPITETEFQQVAQEGSPSHENAGNYFEPLSAVAAPPMHFIGGLKYQRDVRVAAHALAQAEFKCEVDDQHTTFLSRAKRRPYVEAHHLVPMSRQGMFESSLDVPANVVALCATCHKLLHHGLSEEKKKHLVKLLEQRRERLAKMNITVEKRLLLSFYSKDLLDDE